MTKELEQARTKKEKAKIKLKSLLDDIANKSDELETSQKSEKQERIEEIKEFQNHVKTQKLLISEGQEQIKELEEAIKEEEMNQGDWSEMWKTMEWVNSGIKKYAGIIALVGLLSGILYSTGTFQNYLMNKKNRDEKQEADEKIIKSFLGQHNMETEVLVKNAGLMITSNSEIIQSEYDSQSAYFHDTLNVEEMRNAI